ncbi:MAG: hypothetical protein ACHQ1D_01170 [Nitrososphaerales archaeon]
MSESIFDVYEEFDKIILRSYSPERICLMENAAEKMFEDLDWEIAENLEWDSTGEFDERIDLPYDQEEDWDFPDPPEFLS